MNSPQFYNKNATNSAIADSSSVGMLGKNSGHGRKFSRYSCPFPSYDASSPSGMILPSFGNGSMRDSMTFPMSLDDSSSRLSMSASSNNNMMNSTPGLHPYRVEENVSISARLSISSRSNVSNNAPLPMDTMDGRIRPTATDRRASSSTAMDGMMMIGGGARAA